MTRRFALPPELLFDFISDGDNASRWHGSIQESRHLTPLPIRKGTRLFLRATVGAREFSWTQEVTEWDPPRSFRDRMVEGNAPFRSFEDWGRFRRVPGGTEVAFGLDYRLRYGPVGWLVDRVFVLPRVRRDTERSLERVEAILNGTPQ